MKKGELRQIFLVMQELGEIKGSAKFAYGIVKNKSKIKEEVVALDEAMKSLTEYNDDRMILCKKFAEKDKDGKPVEENGRFKGLENNIKFKKGMDGLAEKHKKPLDEVKNLLLEDIEIDFHKMNIDVFPNEIMPLQIEALMPLIEEADDNN